MKTESQLLISIIGNSVVRVMNRSCIKSTTLISFTNSIQTLDCWKTKTFTI